MSQQSRASVGRSGHKPVIDGVPQGSQCVFNVHHPSGWQIAVTAAEVHLVARRTLNVGPTLGAQRVTSLKLTYLSRRYGTSPHELRSRRVFVWADLHGMCISHFSQRPFKLKLSFLPRTIYSWLESWSVFTHHLVGGKWTDASDSAKHSRNIFQGCNPVSEKKKSQ